MEKIRIGLIDRSPATRLGLRVTLENDEDLEIVGETRRGMDTGAEALQLLERASPDVLVLGLPLPEVKATELVRALHAQRPETRLLIFSHLPHIQVAKLLHAGASGYLLETDPLPLLPEAILALARGETWVSPAAQNLAVPHENGHVEMLFSSKERELFPYLAQGMTSQEIADALEVGERTIRDYECSIKKKLGLDNRSRLVAWASQPLTPEPVTE